MTQHLESAAAYPCEPLAGQGPVLFAQLIWGTVQGC